MSDVHGTEEVVEDGGVVGQQVEQEVTPPPEKPDTSIRGNLEKGFKAEREAADKAAKDAKAAKAKPAQKSRAREALEADAVEAEAEAAPEGKQQEQAVAAVEPPASLSKEAKADWAKTPPAVQAALVKREQDMAKGVEELKKKYVDIDQVLQPHMEAIRRHGHTPAEAVNQLFSWMQALSVNPDIAFPALAKSFGYDLGRVTPAQQQQAAQAADGKQPGEQPAGEVPPAVQQYITGMEQRLQQMEQAFTQKLGGLESTMQVQSQAKTQEILDHWAKDKEHFQEVRGLMANLITSGAVPLNNGQVDLDAAYDRAIWAHPDVRGKLITAQETAKAAEAKKKADALQKAQADQAAKARKAGVNISGGAPGAPGGTTPPVKGKGKSVRDSIMEARQQLTEE